MQASAKSNPSAYAATASMMWVDPSTSARA